MKSRQQTAMRKTRTRMIQTHHFVLMELCRLRFRRRSLLDMLWRWRRSRASCSRSSKCSLGKTKTINFLSSKFYYFFHCDLDFRGNCRVKTLFFWINKMSYVAGRKAYYLLQLIKIGPYQIKVLLTLFYTRSVCYLSANPAFILCLESIIRLSTDAF